MSESSEPSIRGRLISVFWIMGINLVLCIGLGLFTDSNNLNGGEILRIIKEYSIPGLVMGLLTLVLFRNFKVKRSWFKNVHVTGEREKLPSELLQEEFDRKYPYYTPKLPPTKPVPSEQKDNPYRYE